MNRPRLRLCSRRTSSGRLAPPCESARPADAGGSDSATAAPPARSPSCTRPPPLERSRRGGASSVTLPRRRATIRSATAKTSSRLWLIITTATPWSATRRTSSSVVFVCRTPSAAVGSSKITIRWPRTVARAIAIAWRCPPESRRTGIVGIVELDPDLLDLRRIALSVAARPVDEPKRPEPEADRLLAEHDVRDRAERVAERQILVDGLDPVLAGRLPAQRRPAGRRSGPRRCRAP